MSPVLPVLVPESVSVDGSDGQERDGSAVIKIARQSNCGLIYMRLLGLVPDIELRIDAPR